MGWRDKVPEQVDDALTDAVVSRGALKEARKFARSVKLNHTYYTIETFATPIGDQDMLNEWVFTHRQPLTHAPMCGAMSAGTLWLSRGPVYSARPEGNFMTLDEYTASGSDGPLIPEWDLVDGAAGGHQTRSPLNRRPKQRWATARSSRRAGSSR